MIGLALAAALAATCLPVRSDRIYARELAPAMASFSAAPDLAAVSFAPLPGVTRIFAIAELRQIGARYGIDAVAASPVCFAWVLQPLVAEAAREAMLTSLGGGMPALEILELSRAPVPAGRVVFPGSPAASGFWRGYVEYAPGKRFDTWARVDVHMTYDRVVTARSLRAGECLDASNLRVETASGAPPREGVLARIEDGAGQCLRRPLPEGAAVPTSALTTPPAVNRGDSVRVAVHAGRARVSFDGTAEAAAVAGQFVTVRNPETKKALRARVIAPGQAVIDLNTQEMQ